MALELAMNEGWDYLGLRLHRGSRFFVNYSTDGSPYSNDNPYFGGQPPSLAYEVAPEPTTLSLLTLGGLALLRRRS